MFIFWCITIVYVERILHCTRHVEKKQDWCIKSTNYKCFDENYEKWWSWRIDRRRGAKKSENGGGMNINFFFFTLFQNFMVPLDSSWWDLFKSAESPQFTINLPSLFGTYLWIFFIFTSVPILKKSCCRKNQIFSRNILPAGEHREWSPLGVW